MTTPDNPRGELEAAAQQTRAWLEWLAECGADGVALDGVTQEQLGASGRSGSSRSTAVQEGGQARPTTTARPGSEPAAARAPARPDRSVAAAAPIRPEQPAAAPLPSTGPARPEGKPPSASGGLPLAERQARLAALEEQARACTRCPLHEHRQHVAFARGSAQASLAFVGEGPGADEDAQGVPFVGAAGQLLDRMIGAMGFDRDEVYVCNIVKCRPPGNRKPTVEEMQACEPFLQEQLELVAPEVLVALGATAVQSLLGWYDTGTRGPGITRLRGNWKVYAGRTPLMPTFHPAYLLRSPDKKREVWRDLQQVMGRLGREPPERKGGTRQR